MLHAFQYCLNFNADSIRMYWKHKFVCRMQTIIIDKQFQWYSSSEAIWIESSMALQITLKWNHFLIKGRALSTGYKRRILGSSFNRMMHFSMGNETLKPINVPTQIYSSHQSTLSTNESLMLLMLNRNNILLLVNISIEIGKWWQTFFKKYYTIFLLILYKNP